MNDIQVKAKRRWCGTFGHSWQWTRYQSFSLCPLFPSVTAALRIASNSYSCWFKSRIIIGVLLLTSCLKYMEASRHFLINVHLDFHWQHLQHLRSLYHLRDLCLSSSSVLSSTSASDSVVDSASSRHGSLFYENDILKFGRGIASGDSSSSFGDFLFDIVFIRKKFRNPFFVSGCPWALLASVCSWSCIATAKNKRFTNDLFWW